MKLIFIGNKTDYDPQVCCPRCKRTQSLSDMTRVPATRRFDTNEYHECKCGGLSIA